MSSIVLDASAVVDVLARPRYFGSKVIDAMEAHEIWWVPEGFDLEVLHALRRLSLRRTIDSSELIERSRALAGMALGRVPTSPLLDRITSLSATVSTYDAAYVAVAELLQVPLLTTDARLARASGPRCEFLLVADN